MLKDIPTLCYHKAKRSQNSQKIISEIYRQAGVKFNIIPVSAGISTFIICSLNLVDQTKPS